MRSSTAQWLQASSLTALLPTSSCFRSRSAEKGSTGPLKNTREAIYYAIRHGANVINLSLSANDPKHSITTLDDAINCRSGKKVLS